MPLPPPLTEEQRKQALEKAAIARRKRAELKEQLKSGRTSLKELLDRGATATDRLQDHTMRAAASRRDDAGVGEIDVAAIAARAAGR